ncbi:ATP-binding protein, partial [Streptomyces shenzhenensis]
MTEYASPVSPLDDALLVRLARLRDRVAELVASRSAADPTASDPLRGLYLSVEAVQHLLGPTAVSHTCVFDDATGFEATDLESAPAARLERLAVRLGLTELDTRILLIALAPDLDRSFEPLYGYLNDDVSRRRATTGLALDLCGLPVHLAEARARFHPSAPLTALGLLTVEEPELPFLSRSLRVPDRLVAHLLGDDTLDAALVGSVRPLDSPSSALLSSPSHHDFTAKLAARLASGPRTVYLREHREGDGLACAAAALRAAGVEAMHFTPTAAEALRFTPAAAEEPRPDILSDLLPRLLREARLRDRAIVVSPLPEKPAPLLRALTEAGVPVVFAESRPYDPQW